MRRVRTPGKEPGLYALLDGTRRVGMWLRIGVDQPPTADNFDLISNHSNLSKNDWRPFDSLPVNLQTLLAGLVEPMLDELHGAQAVGLVVLEWSRALLVRTDLGSWMDARAEAISGVAICQLRAVREPGSVLDGQRRFELRLVPASALRVGPDHSADRWLHDALEAAPEGLHHPSRPLPLPPIEHEPGGGTCLALNGLLDRHLRVQPQAPWALVYQCSQDSSVVWTLTLRAQLALFALGAIALAAGLFSLAEPRVQPLKAVRSAPAALVARGMGACDPSSAAFVEALRCQVARLAQHGQVSPDCEGGGPPPQVELSPELCGLLDWSVDAEAMAPLTEVHGALTQVAISSLPADIAPLNPGELALSQACFQVMGEPPAYAMAEQAGRRLDGRWGDPERLLRGPDALVPLVSVASGVKQACAAQRDRLQQRIQGAQIAALIGDAVGQEPLALRDAVTTEVKAGLSGPLGDCLDAGVRGGPAAATYGALCPDPDPNAGALALLGAAPSDPPASVVDRYLKARYRGPVPEGAAAVWSCHQLLGAPSSGKAPAFAEGAWGAPVPLVRSYAPGNGAQSELILDAALLGQADAGSLDVCWKAMADLLDGFDKVHPLLNPVDPKGRLTAAQQVCGQVCSEGFHVGASGKERLTPGADLAACLDGSEHPTAGSFARLTLPWNGQTSALPPASSARAWQEPAAAQICAFNLLAQGRLDLGRKGWMPEGLTGPTFGGEDPAGVTGGPDGEAVIAANRFSGLTSQPRSGERECGAVALQCFMAEALTVADRGSKAGWPRRWSDAVTRLARQEPAATAQENPWCGLIYPYLAPRVITEQLDATCRTGVELARFGVSDTLTALQGAP